MKLCQAVWALKSDPHIIKACGEPATHRTKDRPSIFTSDGRVYYCKDCAPVFKMWGTKMIKLRRKTK